MKKILWSMDSLHGKKEINKTVEESGKEIIGIKFDDSSNIEFLWINKTDKPTDK